VHVAVNPYAVLVLLAAINLSQATASQIQSVNAHTLSRSVRNSPPAVTSCPP